MDVETVKSENEEMVESKEKELLKKLQNDIDQNFTDSIQLIGRSRPILELKKRIQKVAPLDCNILILGETGTGKEVVAKMIHHLSGRNSEDREFFAVHCGGILDRFLERKLFGHEKGSFTGAYRTQKGYFEIASAGTIFLDEIGDTTHSFQVKLLRVLQDKKFRRIGGTETLQTNARILAATNRDLVKAVSESLFREDLFYRLNVITLKIAPLRERPEDVPLLIRYFLSKYTKKHNQLGIYLKPETIKILQRQYWRGNVRELENAIERLVALAESDWISPEDLPDEYLNTPDPHYLENAPFLIYSKAKEQFEKEYITRLLTMTNGNVSKAAELAAMPRQNLHLKIKKHKIVPRQRFSEAKNEN